MAGRYCGNCGHELGVSDSFCPNCGKSVVETAYVPTPEADVPVPPPPQQAGDTPSFAPAGDAPQAEGQQKRNPVLVGCLAIVALIVVFSVVGTCGSGGGGSGEPEQEQAAAQGDQENQEAQKKIEEAQQRAAEAEKEAEEARAAQERAEEEREAAEAQAQQEAEEQQAEEERQAAEEQERQEEAAAAQEAAEAEAAKTAKIGETVRAGDAEWTVTSARRTNVLKQKGFGQFGESKQGDFVVMDFTFTNLASDAVTLDTVSLPLFDSEGREYQADTDTFGYIPVQKDIFLNQVNPGVTQEGRIIYSVAPGSKGFTVRAGDLSLFGGEEAKIALGF